MIGHLCSWGEQCPLFRSWHIAMRNRVRVWDNNSKTVDRYTVAISHMRKGLKVWDVFNMSDEPLSPAGIDQFNYTEQRPSFKDTWEYGKRRRVIDLPEDVRIAIEHRLA